MHNYNKYMSVKGDTWVFNPLENKRSKNGFIRMRKGKIRNGCTENSDLSVLDNVLNLWERGCSCFDCETDDIALEDKYLSTLYDSP